MVPLHAHLADGSIGDSAMNTKAYVKKAKALGMTHLAMTDHGSMSAMIDFYDACKDEGIIPIIGMEAYVTNDRTVQDKAKGGDYSHLVLLAKNKEGVKNLIQIHNDAQWNGVYYKPRTDKSILKQYGKHIIALSACVAGEIPKLIMKQDGRGAIDLINEYKGIFDEFYLEIQPGDFKEQLIVNSGLVRLSEITNTPLVVTNDIHYLDKDDWKAHNFHVQSIRKKPFDEMAYPDKCYYLMNEVEMYETFPRAGLITDDIIRQAISNTERIASQCDGKVDFQFEMPQYSALPEGETSESYITLLCFKKLNSLIYSLSDPSVYVDRLLYELNVIEQLGFCGYFLMVWDFIDHAHTVGIDVGPGRGSCGASIVSWLLGITIADPIKYNLLFERFLSPNRHGLPDIDIDFDSARRSEMQEYAMQKYGYDCCALVMTKGMRKAKGAIRDAARLLDIDLETADIIAKLIPMTFYDDEGEKSTDLSISESLAAEPKLIEYQTQFPALFDMAMKMESLPCSAGVHPAGLLISPTSLSTKLPIKRYTNKKTKQSFPVACFTKENVERIAIKFDFLALKTISVISNTIKDVNANIDLSDETFYQDMDVWKSIGSKFTTGMFQISSNTYKQRMPRLAPTTIEQLAACLALIRGPCISAKTDEQYMQIVEGKRKIDPISREYYAVTKDTNGIAIYQEEVMKLAVVHGFSTDDSYVLLKAASKKKIEKLKSLEGIFKEKATAKGVPVNIQERIFQIIMDAGLYSFNQPHAICYATISYVSAWLKHYYPVEFLANLLTNVYDGGKDEVIIETLKDCRKKGIKFLPLDINKSDWKFTAENGYIRIGFCAIKAFGEKAAINIIECRPFVSIENFLEKIDGRLVNKKVASVAIFAGCFDWMMQDREQIYHLYCAARNIDIEEKLSPCKNADFEINADLATLEKTLLRGEYLHFPAAELDPSGFNKVNPKGTFTAKVYIAHSSRKKDSRGNMMAFFDAEASDSVFRCVVFSSTYDSLKRKKDIDKGNFVTITARKDKDDTCVVLNVA